MNPSDIHLSPLVPLVGTFGKHEAEIFASLLVATLAANGDTWRPATVSEIVAHTCEHPPAWVGNPFRHPNIDELVDRGGATMHTEDGERVVAFTPAGIRALERHMRLPRFRPRQAALARLSWDGASP